MIVLWTIENDNDLFSQSILHIFLMQQSIMKNNQWSGIILYNIYLELYTR